MDNAPYNSIQEDKPQMQLACDAKMPSPPPPKKKKKNLHIRWKQKPFLAG